MFNIFKRKNSNISSEKDIIIKNLNPKEYASPRDEKYLQALKLNPAFDLIFKSIMEYGIDRVETIPVKGDSILVTEKNMPKVYGLVKQCCENLGIENMPEIFMSQDPYLNAYTTGVKNPILVIHDSLFKRFTEKELKFIIGHELGHIKSEHVQYHTIGNLIVNYGETLIDFGTSFIPVAGSAIGTIAMQGLEVAYYDWSRQSELTADHAGLLACQDLYAAISALEKLAGMPKDELTVDELNDFLEQAKNFENLDDDKANKFIKILMILKSSHPWTVLRAKELMIWVQNGEYARILKRSSSWFENELQNIDSDISKCNSEILNIKNGSSDNKLKNIFVNQDKKINDLENKIAKLTREKEDILAIYHNEKQDVIDKLTRNTVKELKF